MKNKFTQAIIYTLGLFAILTFGFWFTETFDFFREGILPYLGLIAFIGFIFSSIYEGLKNNGESK